MCENLARDGQQRDSSVVMTVMSAAFPFVKWEYYTLSPVLWNVALLPRSQPFNTT